MSEAVISGAIQKLERFLVETPSITISYKQTLQEVTDELRDMLDFLRDKKSIERRRLSYLLADFAEMAQVSADSVEMAWVSPRSMDEFFFNTYMAISLDWLRKTKNRMVEFGVREGVTVPKVVGDEGVVVGVEKDVQQLIGRAILIEQPFLVPLCIKGMIGAGKTTLARQVYNHLGVIEKFKRRAWVNVSRYTSIKEVLVELMHQLVGLDGDSLLREEMDIRSLQQMLRQRLHGTVEFY